MVIVSLNNISKLYGVESILDNVSFHINKGDKVGIVGANGAGKTTLLNIISGKLSADSGEVFISSDTRTGYLTQSSNFSSEMTVYDAMLDIFSDLRTMEVRMEELTSEISRISSEGKDVSSLIREFDTISETYKQNNGYGYKSEIKGILNSLAFPQSFFSKHASELSGGEKTRLSLAALLLRKPDILLLDEPTNHLDIGTLSWLEQYVKGYSGTILLISHDRYFLDHTVNKIIEVENHTALVYEGNYTQYVEKKKMRMESMLREYEKQQTIVKHQEDLIRRYKERGTEKLAKRAHSREKMLEHMELSDKPVINSDSIKIKFKDSARSGNDVLQGFDLSMSFGEGEHRRLLFENVSFSIKRGEKICIVGSNGIGKTTLLKIMMSELEPKSGHIKIGHNVDFAYYDQEQRLLNNDETVLGELHNSYRLYDATELRGMLGHFLFRNDDVFKKVGDLSGGEKARLSLLKIMLSGANVLIMDEPTNHLDISSKEVFESAISAFPGNVIIVSHDRYLLNKIPTRIWELSGAGITDYPGKYDYYVEKKSSLNSGKKYLSELSKNASLASDSKPDASARAQQDSSKEERRRIKEEQAIQRRAQREKEKTESEIAVLEEKISSIEKEMCSEKYFNDHVKLQKMNDELEALKQQLEELYDTWLIMTDGAE